MDPTLFPFLEGGVGPGAMPPVSPGVLGQLLGTSAAGAPYMPPGSTAASVGGNVANVPLPPPRPAMAGPGVPLPSPRPPMPSAAMGGAGPVGGSAIYTPSGQQLPEQARAMGLRRPGVGGTLQEAMRGVQAAGPPQAQQVRTPAAPQMQPVGASQMINLLSSLGIGPQQALQMGLGRRFG